MIVLSDQDKERAKLHRISAYGHDCAEHLYYDGGVGRCSRCERAIGQLIRELYSLALAEKNKKS